MRGAILSLTTILLLLLLLLLPLLLLSECCRSRAARELSCEPGVVAAVISHPADTLLSKMNKGGAGGSGGMFSRMGNIASEVGLVNLCTTGLGARCIMIGTLTAGQFGIFDIVMSAVGASKFHFHDPKAH